jgi:hypothetical protein
MSEIELQVLLDRTNPLDDDEEAMDMIVLDGVRINKFDISALKVGKNVPFEMKEELKKFNSKFLGKESVFHMKNGAPRILTQYKDEPYTLELLDQYTTTMPSRSLSRFQLSRQIITTGSRRRAESWSTLSGPRPS